MTPRLTSVDYIKQLIRSYELRVKKRLGQHFMISPAVIERIVDLAGVGPQDTVIEIGPGLGALTERLAERARRVVAVEIDRDLIPVLQELFRERENVLVRQGDILEIDLEELTAGERCKVIGNLPYYITSPIVKRVLESRLKIDSFTVMVQKEVAERMTARPSSKEYGLLTVGVQYFAEVSFGGVVPRSAFWPQPEVESALVKMTPYRVPPVKVADEEFFFDVARAAFGQRRKMLGNALKGIRGGKKKAESDLASVIEAAGINPQRRGETLSLEEMAVLANHLFRG
ncbi:MAG: 16S rRNA (adenine(1518)-N(6)/adenine(1519)-N(6))-dimethyltransferase RsmA [Firmicutes bacterium]|nr:16S rRNA (adenine(1518)-N(6)/adenine(1519)-N(6))-dimethyltransferase RsmA [Bacillota bacterium]